MDYCQQLRIDSLIYTFKHFLTSSTPTCTMRRLLLRETHVRTPGRSKSLSLYSFSANNWFDQTNFQHNRNSIGSHRRRKNCIAELCHVCGCACVDPGRDDEDAHLIYTLLRQCVCPDSSVSTGSPGVPLSGCESSYGRLTCRAHTRCWPICISSQDHWDGSIRASAGLSVSLWLHFRCKARHQFVCLFACLFVFILFSFVGQIVHTEWISLA